VNCTAVRALLPEHSLGVADGDAGAVERHLAWCAACRREARDLQGASASLAFALAPADAPPELEDRVVGAVGDLAGVAPRRARRARRGVTLLLAAAVAVAGLFGGAVMARREPADDPSLAIDRQIDERNSLLTFIQNTMGRDTLAVLGVLRPDGDGAGGGSAVALLNGRRSDQVMVIANGLRAGQGPYRVELADGEGTFIRVGRPRLDPGGGFTVGLVTPVDLTGFVNVLVRDGAGDVVLSGTLREDAPPSSPSAGPPSPSP
jgi:hypothetical protein